MACEWYILMYVCMNIAHTMLKVSFNFESAFKIEILVWLYHTST
jgi:hypothetical protein